MDERSAVWAVDDVEQCLAVAVPRVQGNVARDPDEFVCLGEIGGESVQAPGSGGEFGVEELALATFDGLRRVLELLSFGVRVGANVLQLVPEGRFTVAAEAGREADAV